MSTLSLKITKSVNSSEIDNTWLDKSLSGTNLPQEFVIANLKLCFMDGQYMLLQDTGMKAIKKEHFLIEDYQLQLTVDEVSLNTEIKEEPYFGRNLKNYSITDFDLNNLNDLISIKPNTADINEENSADFLEFLCDPLAFLENGLPITETLQHNVIPTTNHEKGILKIS